MDRLSDAEAALSRESRILAGIAGYARGRRGGYVDDPPSPSRFWVPTAKQPNWLINLAYVGVLFLAGAVLTLGVGLIRAVRRERRATR